MEVEAELLGLLEDALAQVEQHRLADPRGENGVPGHGDRAEDAGDDERAGGQRDREPVLRHRGRQSFVDAIGDERGSSDLGCRRAEHDDAGQDDALAQRFEQRDQQPDRTLPHDPAFLACEVGVVFIGDSEHAHFVTILSVDSPSGSRLEIT